MGTWAEELSLVSVVSIAAHSAALPGTYVSALVALVHYQFIDIFSTDLGGSLARQARRSLI